MAAAWSCPNCGVDNDDYRFTCSACGTVRGPTTPAADPDAPLAEAPVSSADPTGVSLNRAIERGLRAYFADPAGLEYATFSVVGTEHVYVQFTLSGGQLVGEAVAERFLPSEERHRVQRSVLEELGFRLVSDANWTRTWPWPADAGSVAATAAEVLRSYGVPDNAALNVATARTTGGLPARTPDAAQAAPVEAAEPVTRSLLRRFAPQVAIGLGVLLVSAIGAWYFNASRSDGGEITRSGDLPASELRVGDCFDLKDPTAENVDDVTAIVCADEHEFEAFFAGSLAAGDFPGEAAFSTFVEDQCVPAFHAYVGTPYLDSELDIFYFVPTPEAWVEGDRSVQCAVYHPLISRLTGTLKGSQR